MQTYQENAIKVHSGSFFNYSCPDPDSFNIRDIATGLSNTCRFSGQLEEFYSVAQHCLECVKVAELKGAGPDLLKSILLHDASEAFCCDIPRPLKAMMPEYLDIEKRVAKVISDKYQLIDDPMIKEIDDYMLGIERWKFHGEGFGGVTFSESRDFDLDCLPQYTAKNDFLNKAISLGINVWF